MKVTIQQQIDELSAIKTAIYTAINTACTDHNKPTIPVAKQGKFSYYATHILENLCSSQPTTYTVTASTRSSDMGTVTGSGSYEEGATVTLKAIPNTGYSFIRWTKGGSSVSDNEVYTFTASSATAGEYVATFKLAQWTVTVETNDETMGTVEVQLVDENQGSVSESIQNGTSVLVNNGGGVKLIASVTDPGIYQFNGWYKDGDVASVNTYFSVENITSDEEYVGNFGYITGNLVFDISNYGNGNEVTYEIDGESPVIVQSTNQIVTDIRKNTSVTLTAAPSINYTFDDNNGWIINSISKANPCTVTIDKAGNTTCQCEFQKKKVHILKHLCQTGDSCADINDFNSQEIVTNYSDINSLAQSVCFTSINNWDDFNPLVLEETSAGPCDNAAILLVPEEFEITSAKWLDSFGGAANIVFVDPQDGDANYIGYKYSGTYNRDSVDYTIYVLCFGNLDVNDIVLTLEAKKQEEE